MKKDKLQTHLPFKLFLSKPYMLEKDGSGEFSYNQVDISLKHNELSRKVKLWIKEQQNLNPEFIITDINRLDFKERLTFKVTYRE